MILRLLEVELRYGLASLCALFILRETVYFSLPVVRFMPVQALSQDKQSRLAENVQQ